MDTIEHFPIFTRRSVPHARVEATPGFGNIAAQNRPPSRLTAAPQRYRHLGTRATWPGSTVCLVDEHDDGIADSGFGHGQGSLDKCLDAGLGTDRRRRPTPSWPPCPRTTAS